MSYKLALIYCFKILIKLLVDLRKKKLPINQSQVVLYSRYLEEEKKSVVVDRLNRTRFVFELQSRLLSILQCTQKSTYATCIYVYHFIRCTLFTYIILLCVYVRVEVLE